MPETVPTVRFRDWDCKVEFSRYTDNNRLAIILFDAKDGEQIAVASVNLPEAHLPVNHVFIKDWSENAGMLQALVDAKIVRPTGRRVPTGYVEADECEVLINPEVQGPGW